MAVAWADAVMLAGDTPLARRTLELALDHLQEPILGIHAATVTARLAVEAEEWDQAAAMVARAEEFLTGFVAAAAVEATTVTVSDTLSDFRGLAAHLVTAPSGAAYDRLLSRVADLGSSLQLSAELTDLRDALKPRAPTGTRLQVLHWLDAGTVQLPLLVLVDEHGTSVYRGKTLPTDAVSTLGARIAGRIGRSPALDPVNVLAGIPQVQSFRDLLKSALSDLPVEPDLPLSIVLSAPMLGIPMHVLLADYDVAYTPSVTVAVALAAAAAAESWGPDEIAEICCWCHGDHQHLIQELVAGGAALGDLCRKYGRNYTVAQNLEATPEAVRVLVQTSRWLKLSCHGLADPERRRFALLLSDGEQLPPGLQQVLDRPEFARRYLFDWGDLTNTASRCRVAISSACLSGSLGATAIGEQIGLARSYLRSSVLAFVAPLWPVAAGPGQRMVNELIDRCLREPDLPLATQLRNTRAALTGEIPPRVRDAFVLHGHPGPPTSVPSTGMENP